LRARLMRAFAPLPETVTVYAWVQSAKLVHVRVVLERIVDCYMLETEMELVWPDTFFDFRYYLEADAPDFSEYLDVQVL
jgi:hypothetical protein